MIKVTKQYYCDLCGVEGAESFKTLAKFHTEQNEGRIVTPYITTTNIDLCKKCLEKVVILNGEGAMGNNRFWLNKNK